MGWLVETRKMLTSKNEQTFRGICVQNLFSSNTREQKKLEEQIKKLNSTARFQMNKIDREIVELKEQLVDNQKMFGTRCDIKRRASYVHFPGEERVTVREGVAKLGELKFEKDIEKSAWDNFRGRRRHTISETVNVATHRNLNPARIIVTTKTTATLSEETEDRSVSQNSSCCFTRRKQSFASASQLHVLTTSRISKENECQRPMTSRKWSRQNSMSSPSLENTGEKTFRKPCKNETTKRAETHYFDAQKRSNIVKESNGVQVKNKARHILQRRHTMPDFMLPANQEQNNKIPFINTRTRQSTGKLTAKLPNRVDFAKVRGGESESLKQVRKTIDSFKIRRPTPVEAEERTKNETDEEEEEEEESKDEIKDNNLEVTVEDKQQNDDEEEEEDKDQEQEEASGYGEEVKTNPIDEPCGIPKITLAEKIEKFFAGAIESEAESKITGHYADVLEIPKQI
jgi:hypothetical protein